MQTERKGMKKIPLHGKHGEGKFALVDDEAFDTLSQARWIMNSHGYACRFVTLRGNQKLLQMHTAIIGVREGFVVDHINQNRLDNRRSNLRHATRTQNSLNCHLYRNNTSGYRGVYKQNGHWIAMTRIKDKRLYLGSFKTAEDAARAYDIAVRNFRDKHARLNFPQLTSISK